MLDNALHVGLVVFSVLSTAIECGPAEQPREPAKAPILDFDAVSAGIDVIAPTCMTGDEKEVLRLVLSAEGMNRHGRLFKYMVGRWRLMRLVALYKIDDDGGNLYLFDSPPPPRDIDIEMPIIAIKKTPKSDLIWSYVAPGSSGYISSTFSEGTLVVEARANWITRMNRCRYKIGREGITELDRAIVELNPSMKPLLPIMQPDPNEIAPHLSTIRQILTQ